MDSLTREQLIEKMKHAEEKAEKERERADKERERADKAEALKDGKYYATIRETILPAYELIPPSSLETVRRLSRCDRFYKTAIEAAESDSPKPAKCASRTSGYDEAEKTEAKKRKRSITANGLDGTHQTAAEVAHLVPHSPQCASFYGELLEAMVGVKFEEPKHERLQVLIHGQQGDDGKIKRTGIKHCVMNLLRVMHQKHFMDTHPSQVLILPILEVDHVLRFGEPGGQDFYWIAVLCESPEVYKQMVLTGDYETCSENEVETALLTLRQFTFAVAEHARDNIHDLELESLSTEKTALKPARNALQQSRVIIPTSLPLEGGKRRVLKLRLANDGKGATTCDPWLLCLKSAIMYSSFVGNKLLPGCFMPSIVGFSSQLSLASDYYHDSGWSVWIGNGFHGTVPDEIVGTTCDVASDVSSCN